MGLAPTHNAQDFLRLMREIVRQHRDKNKIHVVLDNEVFSATLNRSSDTWRPYGQTRG